MSDYTHRGNIPHFNRARAFQPFPEWVGNVPTASQFVRMSKEAFADKDSRVFPVSNPTATFYSALDAFYRADEVQPEVLDRVKAACAMFDIEASVCPYLDFFADDLEKSASAPVDVFALDLTLHGTDVRMLPVNDVESVVKSASDLHDMLESWRIPYLLARPAALTIVKTAAELGVDMRRIPTAVLDMGTERAARSGGDLRHELSKRASWGRHDEEATSAQYFAAADEFDETGDADILLHKIASIDMLTEIYRHYRFSDQHGHVPMPHALVFNGPTTAEIEKMAKVHVVVNDITIPLAAFANVDPTEAEFKLTKRASSAVREMLAYQDARDVTLEVANWSDDDRSTLCRLLVAANP